MIAPGVQGNSITGSGSTTPEEIVVSSLRDHRFPYLDREGLVRISRT